jgi:hypothetical protein
MMRRTGIAISVAFVVSCVIVGLLGRPFGAAIVYTSGFAVGWLAGDVIRWAWGRWKADR